MGYPGQKSACRPYRRTAGRVICHGDADSEVFQCTGRVFFPVGTVKQVVFAVYLVALGRPEATHAPAGGILARWLCRIAASAPIIGSLDRDAATVLASAVKVVPPIDSTQDKWIRRRERQLRCFWHSVLLVTNSPANGGCIGRRGALYRSWAIGGGLDPLGQQLIKQHGIRRQRHGGVAGPLGEIGRVGDGQLF